VGTGQYLTQKRACAFFAWCVQHNRWWALFDDQPAIHKDKPICNSGGEVQLMRDNERRQSGAD
jgi:hypothetical protein